MSDSIAVLEPLVASEELSYLSRAEENLVYPLVMGEERYEFFSTFPDIGRVKCRAVYQSLRHKNGFTASKLVYNTLEVEIKEGVFIPYCYK